MLGGCPAPGTKNQTGFFAEVGFAEMMMGRKDIVAGNDNFASSLTVATRWLVGQISILRITESGPKSWDEIEACGKKEQILKTQTFLAENGFRQAASFQSILIAS